MPIYLVCWLRLQLQQLCLVSNIFIIMGWVVVPLLDPQDAKVLASASLHSQPHWLFVMQVSRLQEVLAAAQQEVLLAEQVRTALESRATELREHMQGMNISPHALVKAQDDEIVRLEETLAETEGKLACLTEEVRLALWQYAEICGEAHYIH